MGCKMSAHDRTAAARSKAIGRTLKKDWAQKKGEIKLLLLGTGESGKSTIVKQLKIIHNRFSNEDLERYRPVIYSNTLKALMCIVNAMPDLDIQFGNEDREMDAHILNTVIKNHTDEGILTPRRLGAMQRLWADPGVLESYGKSSAYQLCDNAKYFLDDLERLGTPHYEPTEMDILRTRIPTTGIVEVDFYFKNMSFRLYDVGGQRSERKKWIHCFEDVTAIIFCVAISEYDQLLLEDNRTNRMHESLQLFESICNSKWFTKTSMITFLNKRDIFEEKILKTPLTVCFPEYDGPQELDEASAYIQAMFETRNRNFDKDIYFHLTCATDTTNVLFVFDSITDVIVGNNLKGYGLF